MFTVFDNNKPADCHHHKVDKSWGESTFDTFEEALSYARKWLGKGHETIDLKLGKALDYSGEGDMIEIIKQPHIMGDLDFDEFQSVIFVGIKKDGSMCTVFDLGVDTKVNASLYKQLEMLVAEEKQSEIITLERIGPKD